MLLRNKPKLPYCGITIVLSNPSRFDVGSVINASGGSLLTATGGDVFFNHCMAPDYNKMQCDIRVMEDRSPWLPNTKCIILLGEAAMHFYCPDTKENTLNEMRGSPHYVDGIPAIATYLPQDAADPRNHEKTHNKLALDYVDDEYEDDSDDKDEGDVKRFSFTKRRNYAFWIRMDVKKCKTLIKSGESKWPIETSPNYYLRPPADEVIKILRETKNQIIDFDIETDYEEQNLLCFAFTIDGRSVYSVPILDYNYQWAYSCVPSIMGALAIACRDNTIVAHNGATFDFLVLAVKYRIVVQHPYDTMLTAHRIFPDVEKSLGHITSLWTYQQFHKDSDSRAYFTRGQMEQKLLYCGKDVNTMRLSRIAMEKFATTIPGLKESIALAQRSIKPYLTTTIQGISFDDLKRRAIIAENDRLMKHYLRAITLLIGETGMAEARQAVKKATGGFPNSNPQCLDYFQRQLGYKIPRGKPKEDGTPSYSLGKKNMYKFALQYDNPVITFCLLYRNCKTETGYLKFMPWKDDDGKIMTEAKWDMQLSLNL